MTDSDDKALWGQVEKIGKGTKASYDMEKKTLTFAFNRDSNTTGEQLRKLRERLMKDIKDLGYSSRMKYNGEVIIENLQPENTLLEKKNGKLIIRLNKKETAEQEKNASEKQA